MKINLTELENKKLRSYYLQKERNIIASQLDSTYLDEYFDGIDQKDVLSIQKADGSTVQEAVKDLFYAALDYDSEEDGDEIIKTCGFGNIDLLKEGDLINNPYFKAIHIQKEVLKNLVLEANYYQPFELFCYEETITGSDNYNEITPIGFYKNKCNYDILRDKNRIWMSITPYEINTMKKAIEKAKGSVLTFGLGLGYYAFMVSEKEEVKSVTIIENDQNVISLFEAFLLQQFPHKEKIHIIKGDAFSYFKKANEYDDSFIDIYHDAEDALEMYIRFKKLERKYKITKPVDYWIEESILIYLRRYVLTLLEECQQGLKEEDYLDDSDKETRILKQLFFALKEKEFISIKEIDALLSYDGLKDLIKNIK